MENSVFIPQAALDQWMSDGSADLREGELIVTATVAGLAPEVASTLAPGRRFRVSEAVHIVRELAATGDHDLIGRVKGKAQLDEIGAEIVQTSMLIGDSAYDIEPGWLGVPIVTREAEAEVDVIEVANAVVT
jgi:hypothetical protein